MQVFGIYHGVIRARWLAISIALQWLLFFADMLLRVNVLRGRRRVQRVSMFSAQRSPSGRP